MSRRRYNDDRERITRNVRVDESGCWVWLRSTNGPGYGHIRTGGRLVLAHRLAYEAFVGPIPDGLQIDHLCRVRACANPEHLEPVTSAENTRRSSIQVTSINRAKIECNSGHGFTEANTGRSARGRYCRACKRAATAAYRARRAAARAAA